MEISEIDDDRIDSILDTGDFTDIEAIQMAYELKERRKADRAFKPITHPATAENTRPWEESICRNCGKSIWRMTDGNGHGWMHGHQIPNRECERPRTIAEPLPAPPEVSNG